MLRKTEVWGVFLVAFSDEGESFPARVSGVVSE